MAAIDKLPSGNWRCRISIGKDENGKYRYKTFTGKTKKEVQIAAAAYMVENDTITGAFCTCAKRYVANREPILSPATIRAYTFMLKRLETAVFWEKDIQAINSKDIQSFVVQMVNESLSVKTMRNYIGLISAVLESEDVKMQHVQLPQAKKVETYLPDEKTMQKVLRAAKGTSIEIELNLALCGLRRSEICALSVDDLNGNEIHIHSAMVYDKNYNVSIKQPKTFESDRRIQIPKHLADMIRERGYVTNKTPNALTNSFKRFLASNGFPPFRLHACRAFFASYAADMGLSEAQILKMGGWATASIYKRNYRRAMNQNEANKKYIDSFFSEKS